MCTIVEKIKNIVKNDIEKLIDDIIRCFPRFFDDFEKWEYGTGVNAGKDFKRIFNKAKKIKKYISKKTHEN